MNEYVINWYYKDNRDKVYHMSYRTFAESSMEAVYDWETYCFLYYVRKWWKDYGITTVSQVVTDWVLPTLLE